MQRLGHSLSQGTQVLAAHAAAAAQAAGTSILSGLRTCDERNAEALSKFEVTVDEGERGSAGQGPWAAGLQEPGKPRVWGNPSFACNIRLGGDGSRENAGRITVEATSSAGSGVPVPVVCRWSRRIANSVNIPVPGVEGSSLFVSADDVATTLRVEVRSTSERFSGTAFGEVGPFELDASTSRNLGDYLGTGSARFPVRFVAADEDGAGRSGDCSFEQESGEWQLIVNCEGVCVVNAVGGGLGVEEEGDEVGGGGANGPFGFGSELYADRWTCRYGSTFPVVHLDRRTPLNFTVRLSDKLQLRLRALTRTQRDLIALTVRCFYGRHWASTAALLQAIGLRTAREEGGALGAPDAVDQALPLDTLLTVHALASQLHASLDQQDRCARERDRAVRERDVLEADIAATVAAYQRMLEDSAAAGGGGGSPGLGTVGGVKSASAGFAAAGGGGGRAPGAAAAAETAARAAHLATVEAKLREAESTLERQSEQLQTLRRDHREMAQKYSSAVERMQTMTSTAGPATTTTSAAGPPAGLSREYDAFNTTVLRGALASGGGAAGFSHPSGGRSRMSTTAAAPGDRGVPLTPWSRPEATASLDVESGAAAAAATAAAAELRGEVMKLKLELQDKENEREAAASNFLYIKTKYDELKGEFERQRRDLMSATATAGATMLTTTGGPSRTRGTAGWGGVPGLATGGTATADSFARTAGEPRLRELERELTSTRKHCDSLIASKSELAEQKLRLETEINELRTQLARTLNTALEKHQATDAEVTETGATRSVLMEKENVRLRAALAERDAEIARLRGENESLRAKIRALAVAE